jgi:hypothetical protein
MLTMADANVKRPKLRWVLVLLMLVQAGLYAWTAYLHLLQIQMLRNPVPDLVQRESLKTQSIATLWLLLATWGFLAGASLVSCVGLGGRRRWAWTGAMVIEGVTLALSLEAYFTHGATLLYYIAMALAVAIVFMLNQSELQVYYRTSNEAEEDGPVARVENTDATEEGSSQWTI